MRTIAVLLALLSAAGCASVDPYAQGPISGHLERSDDVGDCARLLRQVDARIDAAGVRDGGAPRVPGYPYLRVDRFTASLGEAAGELRGAGFAAWSELMARLDRQARAAELANAGQPEQAVAVDACRYVLAVADGGSLARLQQAARVPDDYDATLRALGLYPLTRIAFAAGIADWQQRTRETFATEPSQLPQQGRLQRYAPSPSAPAPAPPPRSVPLLLPSPSGPQLLEWALRHAPALEVDTASDDDRIGALHWSGVETARLAVDSGRPVAYVRTAYTHFAGQVRLQIVYTFWFPSRPRQGAVDLLAGHLDGLVWRVTVDRDGAPLVYDSIHACGCYHLFFPTAAVAVRPQPGGLDEGLFAPQGAPDLAPGERILLRVAARTHYLQRLSVVPRDDPVGTAYTLSDEGALLTLDRPGGGTRSAYDAAGFVPGSERLERLLFWPMGISSAGQMRQWGRHATAFVGRRHFDDPALLEGYFELRRQGAAADRPR
ncbi:MAG: hypothetical protein MUF32_00870 [Burkholderiaceae bacterium]|nr:hypothetical protein [Burkholderiaceae bacterium]